MAVLLLTLAGIAAVREVVRRVRVRRRIAAGTRELEDNALVTLTGTVHPLAPLLTAPVTGASCVAHRTQARVYDPNARHQGRPPVTTHTRTELIRFELRCAAGNVLVEGDRVEIDMRLREIKRRYVAREQAFLEGTGLPYHPDSVTCDQAVVAPGQIVTVHGVARVEAVPTSTVETGFREVATAMRIIGDARHPLVITDV
ncbi:MAG TPA: hypothetical protein VMJ10_21465 [Kofleriaceae bacterium]|nr:hypothetical protein [Kofleriaceae bacterium]